MQIVRAVLTAWCLMLLAVAVQAQVQSSKGMASVNYQHSLTPDLKEKAFRDAQVNAIERYIAESGASQSENFATIRAQVAANLNEYILGAIVVSEENVPDAHRYSVGVKADLNLAKIRIALKNSSVEVNTPEAQKSVVTFAFVARAQDSVKSYDPHKYSRQDDTRSSGTERDFSKSGNEGEKLGVSNIATSSSMHSHDFSKTTTSNEQESGGSVVRRADESTWKLIPTGNLSSIIIGAFGSAGFKAVEAQYVEPQSNGLLSIAALRADYQTGDDLQPQTMKNAVQGLQIARVPYLALATLDVGFPDTDPHSGNTRVYVTVTGRIVDLRGQFPTDAAAVGPEQFAGEGPTVDVAQTNALQLAAGKAARELVSQINVAGIH